MSVSFDSDQDQRLSKIRNSEDLILALFCKLCRIMEEFSVCRLVRLNENNSALGFNYHCWIIRDKKSSIA